MKTISKFNAMYPDRPVYTDSNHIYSMQGVDPLYYLSDSTVQEKDTAPLTASFYPKSTGSSTGSKVLQSIPSSFTTVGNPIDVFFLTQDGNVYGTGSAGNTNFNSPFGGASGLYSRISLGLNGRLLFLSTSGSSIYSTSLTSVTGAWTSQLIPDYYPTLNTVPSIIPFGKTIALASKSSVTTTVNAGSFVAGVTYTIASIGTTNFISIGASSNTIGVIFVATGAGSGSGTATTGANTMSTIKLYRTSDNFTQNSIANVDLGDGWQILKLENYANKYIVAGAYYSSNLVLSGGVGATSNSNLSYLFFWNAQTPRSNSIAGYQFSVKVPGVFVDMVYSNGILYALVLQKSGRYAIYYYGGGDVLKHLFTIQFDTPNLYSGNALFAYPNGVGILLQNKGAYIYQKIDGEEFRYLPMGSGLVPSDSACVANNGFLYTFSGVFWGYIPDTYPGSGTYFNDIDVTTQWVPMDTKLTSVDVYYDSPPSTSGEYIRVTATAWSEDQQDGVYTQQLADITSTVKDTKIKTVLDVKGLTGTMVKLRIQAHSTTSWRPIIRKVELNEDNVNAPTKKHK